MKGLIAKVTATFFLDFALGAYLGHTIGYQLTIILLAIPTALGLLIASLRWPSMQASLADLSKSSVSEGSREAFVERVLQEEFQTKIRAFRNYMYAILCFIIPGFITDTFGFLLLLVPLSVYMRIFGSPEQLEQLREVAIAQIRAEQASDSDSDSITNDD